MRRRGRRRRPRSGACSSGPTSPTRRRCRRCSSAPSPSTGAPTSQISYTASKAGVLAMTRELRAQFAREGIRVNALCPGPINTPLLQELFAKDPERAARRMVHIPMGRFGEATEIAAAVTFLASDDASFITASTFLVDGGISAAYVTPL